MSNAQLDLETSMAETWTNSLINYMLLREIIFELSNTDGFPICVISYILLIYSAIFKQRVFTLAIQYQPLSDVE